MSNISVVDVIGRNLTPCDKRQSANKMDGLFFGISFYFRIFSSSGTGDIED
jgi:hypothetical protein